MQEPLPAFWALKQKPIVATHSRTCSLGPLHTNHWRLQFCGVPISPCQHHLRFMNLLDIPKVCKGQTENLSARDRAEQCIQNSRLDHGTKKPSGSDKFGKDPFLGHHSFVRGCILGCIEIGTSNWVASKQSHTTTLSIPLPGKSIELVFHKRTYGNPFAPSTASLIWKEPAFSRLFCRESHETWD